MKTLGERIKAYRTHLGINQAELAEKCGQFDKREKQAKWGQSRIGNYETNARTPDLEDIKILANALGVEPSQLAFSIDNAIPATIGANKVPLISYVQAGNWNGVNLWNENDFDFEYILTDLDVSEKAFALKIQGDSMETEFKEGDIVIIDPTIQPHAGEFVVAVNNEYEATFKKYRPLGEFDQFGKEHFELIPLNQDYAPRSTKNEEISIVGTMIEHRIYRRKR